MMLDDRYLLVRAAAVYVAAISTVAVWLWQRSFDTAQGKPFDTAQGKPFDEAQGKPFDEAQGKPFDKAQGKPFDTAQGKPFDKAQGKPGERAVAGAVLASLWNVPALLVLHVAALEFGWWRYDATGGLLLGMPVDLLLAWAWLWGALPAMGCSSWPLGLVLVSAFAGDLLFMPAAAPVVRLGPSWIVGDAIGVLAALLPAMLLARLTARDEHLVARAVLQVIAFAGLLLFVLPAIAVDSSSTAWVNPMHRPAWQLSLIVQLLAVPALVGLTAVQEFVTRGGGTPVPFDPPRRIVTTGIYAYLRNPMQLSAVVLLILWGAVLGNVWISAAGVMAHLYSVGLAGWDEDTDLRARFGDDWVAYRRGVRRWRPSWRPWYRSDGPPSRLWVADGCGMCSDVGRWFARRGARHLAILPAETHPSQALRRITYEPGDGARAAAGVEAVARALEHIHLGWALVGALLRLPGVCPFVQLLVDASGGEARTIGGARVGAGPGVEAGLRRLQ